MNEFTDALKNYAVFIGRASRKQYWMFVLIYFVISLVVGFIAGLIHLPILGTIFSLAFLVPSVAIGIRRMHDTDHSGWWILVPFVNLYFACLDSTPGPNQYGENPKGIPASAGFEPVQ